MRTKPVGTGPFRSLVDFKHGTSRSSWCAIPTTGNLHALVDAIEYTIITIRSTALMAFATDQFDMTFPNEITIPLLKDPGNPERLRPCASLCHITATH